MLMALKNPSQDLKIAVIGAGVMGSGIAQKYAASGYCVALVDKNPGALEKSQMGIKKTLEQGVSRQIFSAEDAQGIFSKITFAKDLQSVHDAALIIEAIFEDQAAKKALYNELERRCSPDAIIATNTSSLKVADLNAHLKYKERFLGLHYF